MQGVRPAAPSGQNRDRSRAAWRVDDSRIRWLEKVLMTDANDCDRDAVGKKCSPHGCAAEGETRCGGVAPTCNHTLSTD